MYFLGPKITFLLQVDQFSVVTSSGIDGFENDNTCAATGEMCELIYQEGIRCTLAYLKVETVFMQRPLNFFWYTHRSRRPRGLQPQFHSLSEFTPLSSPFLLTGGAVRRSGVRMCNDKISMSEGVSMNSQQYVATTTFSVTMSLPSSNSPNRGYFNRKKRRKKT